MRRGDVVAGAGLILLALAGAGGMWLWGAGPCAGPGAGPVTLKEAAEIVREELARWGHPDLVPKEVMEFTNHFYVLVVERDTGKGALELLVERDGFVHPEPGPNRMWNTKYGHMAGWYGGAIQAQALSRARAREIAQEFLRAAFPGAEADEGVEFYGYFTFDAHRDGRPFGMLSVNAHTGQVWYHTWHGAFVAEKEL